MAAGKHPQKVACIKRKPGPGSSCPEFVQRHVCRPRAKPTRFPACAFNEERHRAQEEGFRAWCAGSAGARGQFCSCPGFCLHVPRRRCKHRLASILCRAGWRGIVAVPLAEPAGGSSARPRDPAGRHTWPLARELQRGVAQRDSPWQDRTTAPADRGSNGTGHRHPSLRNHHPSRNCRVVGHREHIDACLSLDRLKRSGQPNH